MQDKEDKKHLKGLIELENMQIEKKQCEMLLN